MIGSKIFSLIDSMIGCYKKTFKFVFIILSLQLD